MRIVIAFMLLLTSITSYSFSDSILEKPSTNFQVDTASLTKKLPTKADLANADRSLRRSFPKRKRKAAYTPLYCELVHKRGTETLYAYYERNYSATILSGYNYGLQVFYDYSGRLIGASDDWDYATVNGKLMMKHRYNDCKVYTDYDGQIVLFN